MTPERIIGYLDRCDVEGDCWIWTGASRNSSGYAAIFYAGRTQVGHRLLYEALIGPIPEGLVIHHLCNKRACLNPDHMQPMTHADHARGHIAELPKECPQCGEERDRTESGTLRCLPCARKNYHAYWQAASLEVRQRKLAATRRWRKKKKEASCS